MMTPKTEPDLDTHKYQPLDEMEKTEMDFDFYLNEIETFFREDFENDSMFNEN